MRAREYFEGLRLSVKELVEMEDRVATLNVSATSPRAQGQEPSGGGARTQPMADRTIDAELELERMRAHLMPDLDHACRVLYGSSGRGGVAEVCGSASADAVHGYYLQAMSWQEVADELVRPDSKDGAHWCRNRACAAMRCVDEVGMARLVDS